MELEIQNKKWLEGIEGEFLPKLIISESKVVRVIAGPGAGKTTGLKRRVMRLVIHDQVSPSKIFIGTFTRAIAGELASAIEVSAPDELMAEEEEGVHISTLHALALKLIRENPTSRPGRILRFLLAFEKDAMLYDIGEVLSSYHNQAERKKELNRICASWAEGTNLEMAGFLGEMDRWLRRHGGMLIDEVVQIARIGLESGDIEAGEYDHVIIDEYQDLTAAEQHLVEQIWSGNGSLVVLGDDDQSIYSFRFNHPGGITEFADKWNRELLDDVGIPENRRCGKVIVDLGNAMMAAAGSTKEPMISTRGDEGDLSLVYWPSVGWEIHGLAEYMKARKDTKFLVLVPRRFIGYYLKKAIGEEAQTSFHEEVLEIPVVQERFALASFIANPNDCVALRVLLGFHQNGLEHCPKRNAEAYKSILEVGLEADQLLKRIVDDEIVISGRGTKHLKARSKDVLGIAENLQECSDLHEIIRMIFDPSFAETILDEDKREKAMQDLEQIRDTAWLIQEQLDDVDLSKILDLLRYRVAMRIPLKEAPETRVRIMTLHGAKGLEADVVVLAGVADQLIPGIESRDPAVAEQIREEQRRLLYVSVTRAKRELVISWPTLMKYKEAIKNNVRIDKVWRKKGQDQIVKLGRTRLLPDIPQQPQTGKSWLNQRRAF
jgi:superfamily I DNA/RNA helicase